MRTNCFIALAGMLSCIASGTAGAQSVSISREEMGKVFEQTNTWFRTTPSYGLDVTHASYESYTTPVPVERSAGYFKKDGSNYHSLLLGIHTIQNSRYKIVIDTAEKIIAVANPDQLTWLAYTPDDYRFVLKSSTATRMSKAGRYTFYRVELPENNPVGAYELLVDEKGLAREISWYYNREVRKDPDDKSTAVRPRMRISFSGYKEDPAFNYMETFSEAPYFERKNDKLIVTEKYATFRLLDQRVKK